MTKPIYVRAIALFLLLLLLPAGAFAKSRGTEPLISLDLDALQGDTLSDNAYYQARWLQVTATVPGPTDVLLRVWLDDDHLPGHKDRLIYKRTFKKVQDLFTSPEIFLEYLGPHIEAYRVELVIDGQVIKSANFHRMLLNLVNNTVCLRGLRFRDVKPSLTNQWYTFYPIDLMKAKDGDTIDLVGSNMYLIGKLLIHRNDSNEVMFELVSYDELTPSQLPSDVEVDNHIHNYIISDHEITFSSVQIGIYKKLAAVKDVAPSSISREYKLGQWIRLYHDKLTTPVILYLNGKVGYNPNGLPKIGAVKSGGALGNLFNSFAGD